MTPLRAALDALAQQVQALVERDPLDGDFCNFCGCNADAIQHIPGCLAVYDWPALLALAEPEPPKTCATCQHWDKQTSDSGFCSHMFGPKGWPNTVETAPDFGCTLHQPAPETRR